MQIIELLINRLNISEAFLSEFYAYAKEITIAKKGFFVKQGQRCKYIGIVKCGALYAYMENEDDSNIISDLFSPGSFITSYRSFLTGQQSVGNIRAYEQSSIYVLSYDTYQRLLNTLDWIKFFKHISDTLFIRKCYRENSMRKDAAIERYKHLIAEQPDIEQLFPQYLIASYLNIRPETLSRIKSLDLHQVK
jgi:CRP-like cAMP-binding protein